MQKKFIKVLVRHQMVIFENYTREMACLKCKGPVVININNISSIEPERFSIIMNNGMVYKLEDENFLECFNLIEQYMVIENSKGNKNV